MKRNFSFSSILTGLVLNENGPSSGRRSAGSSLVVSDHSELIFITLCQVLHLKACDVNVPPVTPAVSSESLKSGLLCGQQTAVLGFKMKVYLLQDSFWLPLASQQSRSTL